MTEDTNLSNKQSTVTRNSVTQATALEELQSNVLALPQAVKVVLVTCGVEKITSYSLCGAMKIIRTADWQEGAATLVLFIFGNIKL